MKRYLFLSCIFLLVAGCTQDEQYEFESESNIMALMRIEGSEYSWQIVLVAQTHDIRDSLDFEGDKPTADLVRVWGRVDTFNFRESSAQPWYNATEYETRPSFDDTTLYSFEAVLSWGDTVTAEAYMPTPIRISTPADSDTVFISKEPYDPHVVVWNSCRNTDLYLVYCIPDVNPSELGDISPLYSLPAFTTDTSYAFFLERMVFPWNFDMHYVLRVIAVTPEYIDYMGLLNPTGESCSNLSSGYGMFGGISEDSIRVFITE
jgi:hypothetical protein